MLKIKLSRIGKKNKPMYRLIISEQARDPYGNSLEILGSYNPHTKELKTKPDRIKYWLSQGAQMTPTINNLLVEQKIIEGEKVKASKAKTKKKQVAESAEDKPAAVAATAPEEAKAEQPAAPVSAEETPAVVEKPKEEVVEAEEKKEETA
jgi:small subunit ribosomal protein S16